MEIEFKDRAEAAIVAVAICSGFETFKVKRGGYNTTIESPKGMFSRYSTSYVHPDTDKLLSSYCWMCMIEGYWRHVFL